ncbi:O-methyltransferase, family 2 [Corchorus olitorius]|uniref:O-methyltransferase, family 2 n=1 Tax=Corchorus olitorius TaxID=93759 RepID=A0A1R3GH27_9ROSI|nr:O-methyltransferase, family 2 [Corchorus olitorius]
MAFKSAVELRIANIIHSHDGAVTLSQIASCINNVGSRTPPDINCLSRIMRLLVRGKVFAVQHPSDGGEPLYNLSHSSKWILHDSKLTLAPQIVPQTHPWLMSPWHCFSRCVKEGSVAFKKAHGSEIWDFASEKPEFNGLFNNAMACTTKIASSAIVMATKKG